MKPRRSDLVFAGRVLAFLKDEGLECRLTEEFGISVRGSTAPDRKRLARARFKRLRKAYKMQGKPIPAYWPHG